MSKMFNFCEFSKIWSLRSNNVTRQVNCNRTKIGWKCQNWKSQMRHFGWFSNSVTLFKNIFNIVTVFKNYSKCRIWLFQFWHFPPIFVQLSIEVSGITVWLQVSGFRSLNATFSMIFKHCVLLMGKYQQNSQATPWLLFRGV